MKRDKPTFLGNEKPNYKVGDEVELEIVEETTLGFIAIINNDVEGLLYHNEIFELLNPGDVKRGYVKRIRQDGKIDLSLQQQGYSYIDQVKYVILEKVKTNNGILPLGDKSLPKDIYQQLKMSKKAFKKGIGALYKEHILTIKDHEIKLISGSVKN